MMLSQIDVAILCGGMGTRLRSSVGNSQKAMAKVGERPFLNIILDHLSKQGFSRVVLCTGYQAGQVEDYYRKENFGLTLEFSREEEPLGTGGAIKKARAALHTSPFVVLNGDSFCPVDYAALVKFHQRENALGTVVVSRQKDRKDFGAILLDARKRIQAFQEKVAGNAGLVNAGIYCLGQGMFSLMPKGIHFSLEKDFFPTLPQLVPNDFCGFVVEEKFWDIGTPERLLEAQKNLGR